MLCEFKGVGADLDKPQPRKGSTRLPAAQVLDYLKFARRGPFGNEPVLPRFALVTNMNEFRLYWYDLAPDRYLKFRIRGGDLFDPSSLLSDTDEDRFDRFLFWRLFQPDMLLSEFGRTRFERLIERQGATQQRLEKEFYEEYRAYRLTLYNSIKLQPLPGATDRQRLRFEQSLVELEALEAQAEGRLSLSEITKRKRDGVYYTPEPIVRRIVEETIEPLLARWRTEAGWQGATPTREAADSYWERLRAITIVDPAVGSGAFLITALRYLLAEVRAVAELRYELRYASQRLDDGELTRHILTHNLHGVDINPLSVEIAQLSLWLHTARARETLSSFERTIRCGNSLVDARIYDRPGGDAITPAARERIAAFDWHAAFPEVFARGGFDVVIGNPPYVKLQHFRRVYEETALYLRNGVANVPD